MFPSRISKVVIVTLIGSLVISATAISAQEKRGAQVIIHMKTGGYVEGELIAVRGDSLLILDLVGQDESVGIPEIARVRIIRKSKLWTGALFGFLVGAAAGGAWGYQYAEKNDGEGANGLLLGGAIFGVAGAAAGVGLKAAIGMDQTFDFEGKPEDGIKRNIKTLRKLSRVRD